MSQTDLDQVTRDTLRSQLNVLVFTYAITGLGHLRVTDAIYHGLPIGSRPLALGAQDTSLTFLHRITSIHSILRGVFEWSQNGIGQWAFTKVYRWYLRQNTDITHKQLQTLIDQRYHKPNHIVIVATHFALAHQLAAIKEKLEIERGIEIILIVQVTDDSPQSMWYVDGADLIFVPSYRTKSELVKYGKKEGLKKTQIIVNPYPISPFLASKCSVSRRDDRIMQLSSISKRKIHVAIPVSGAAVGLKYASNLMEHLRDESKRFYFHVVSKNAPFTKTFIKKMKRRSYVSVYASDHDKKVVEAYEKLYKDEVISLELTKPSEQAFKALVTPLHNGGSILLFANPVGRQEYDNLDFLRRHGLIPTEEETKRLYEFCEQDIGFGKDTDSALYKRATRFRGIQIPKNPKQASQFISWAMSSGLFLQMASCRLKTLESEEEKDELGTHGVERFWKIVTRKYLL